MNTPDISRRELLRQGGAALVGLTLLQSPWLAHAFPRRPGEEVLPWVESPQAPPALTSICSTGKSWTRGSRRIKSFSVWSTTTSP
jgi:hypothetical protein